jgi:isoleucyl-tRNA synthetase
MPFPSLPSTAHFEDEILERWKTHDVAARSLRQNEGGERFVFFEGPPTANGRPAIHHVFARTLKDTICRQRQMAGFHVPRKAGWDTQGLPVEIEVQKQQGIDNREQIEALGIAEFNRLCKQSVFTYRSEWEDLSRRMGYWLDYENPYITYETGYIQSCWAILARFHEAGLLKRDFKILPYCPRCSTGLSNHEVAQGYEMVQDPSVTVRFSLTAAALETLCQRLAEAAAGDTPALAGPVSLLVWTTTPWTLFSNVATAADAELTYVVARAGASGESAGELLIVVEARVSDVLGDDAEVLARFPGRLLEGLAYDRPLDLVSIDDPTPATYTVRLADFVSADDGTGIVHMAPAFGADDFTIRQRDDLPLVMPVDDLGCFTEAVPGFEGRFVKEADKDIIRLLKDTGKLWARATVDHSYPHCWRCHSPLLYMARPSWYVLTTKLRDQLVECNAEIDWHPPEIGTKRFGEWLSNNVDWALSRERYWGTPLNIWICEGCDATRAPASLAELGLADDFDPHRPFIDDVTLPCGDCDGTMRRTPEVIDCWFDSGAMPFAQAGWPQSTGGELPENFPADYICEGIDQTRGWFYTMHVISVFLTGKPAMKRVLVNNMLLDGQGKKMSKHKGNVVDPWEVFQTNGADASRWSFMSQGQVWLPKRFDLRGVEDVRRRVFGTLQNCYAFLALYADLDGWSPKDSAPAPADRPPIDRWLLSRLQTLTATVTRAYEELDLNEMTSQIEVFIDAELSNWYVRRNRARFWKSGDSDDKRGAFATLAEALERVALLMAPAVPFLSEWIWSAVTAAEPGESVHLADWPHADSSLIDAELEHEMGAVLAAASLGRSVRAAHDLKLRQPLRRVLVKAADPADAERLGRPDLARLVAEELNVKAVEVVQHAEFRVLSAKANFKLLGPRLGRKMKAVGAVVRELDEATLEQFQQDGKLNLTVEGEAFEFGADEIEVIETGREGYAVAGDGRLVLALDTELDDDLRSEGRAREIINRIQSRRKTAGFDVADRVVVRLASDAEWTLAARTHEQLILGEVLGVRLELLDAEDGKGERFEIEGAALWVDVQRSG